MRFLAKDSHTYYGDAILDQGVTDIAKTTHAHIIEGDIFGEHTVTKNVAVGFARCWSIRIRGERKLIFL